MRRGKRVRSIIIMQNRKYYIRKSHHVQENKKRGVVSFDKGGSKQINKRINGTVQSSKISQALRKPGEDNEVETYQKKPWMLLLRLR